MNDECLKLSLEETATISAKQDKGIHKVKNFKITVNL